MKKIAFVLYANQLLSITYLGGLPNTSELEKELKNVFDHDYLVTFDWEQGLKDHSIDALIIPEPFPPVKNDEKVAEIHVPANLFLTKNTAAIKQIIDNFYNQPAPIN